MKMYRHGLVSLSIALLGLAALAQAPTSPTPPAPPSPPPPPPAPVITVSDSNATLKIDGRMFVGVFDTQKNAASFVNRTLAVPDAKLRFTFTPSKDITIVNRFSNSNAANNGFDYFYVDVNNYAGLLPGQLIRAGKAKIDFGEETWTDNPVESILITNSIGIANGYDGQINFRGSIPDVGMNNVYSLALLNGTGNVTASGRGIGVAGKVGFTPIDDLYVSASAYKSGDQSVTPSLALGSMTLPAGTTLIQRYAAELDARWNYGPTGVKSAVGTLPIAPFQVGAAVGYDHDAITTTTSSNRNSQFGYVEGLYNVTPELYLASRYSRIVVLGGKTAVIGDAVMTTTPTAVSSYNRFSIGAGYRLSKMTHLKAEYTINSTTGSAVKPKLNEIAVGIATKF